MNRAAFYVQAIRGPVLLMTVGALFALHQSGTVSFVRTWPLIIIIIGVMKLAERMLLPPMGAQGPGGAQRMAPGMRDPRS